MISAQLARAPIAAERGERVDLGLMLEIGTCPFPLIRFHGGMSKAHLVHEIPGHGEVLCNENGIAEPLTAHIFNVLATDWQDMDGWVDEAVELRVVHFRQLPEARSTTPHSPTRAIFVPWRSDPPNLGSAVYGEKQSAFG